MLSKMLNKIGNKYNLAEIDTKEFSAAKLGPIKFQIRCFYAEGLGHVSAMQGSTLFGLMKMDTLILNPFEQDMALFTYDRIYAMGNDTILLEIYDTRINKCKMDNSLEKIIEKYSDIPKKSLKPNWFDSIRLSICAKKGKKKQSPRFDRLAEEYFDSVLTLVQQAPKCNVVEKKKAAAFYTEGLLKNGGSSTDLFVKMKGRAYTEKLLREILFGTGNVV